MAKLTDLSDLKKLFPGSGEEKADTDPVSEPDRATSMVTLDIRRENRYFRTDFSGNTYTPSARKIAQIGSFVSQK